MAILFFEGWDQYGGNEGLVPTWGYVDLDGNLSSPGRTGAWCRHSYDAGNVCRVPLDNPVTTVIGAGEAWNMIGCSYDSQDMCGMRFEAAGKSARAKIVAQSDMSIAVYDGPGNFKGKTAPNVLTVGSYEYVEAKVTMNTGGAGTGQVIIRVNGVLKLTVNGIDLPDPIAFFSSGSPYRSGFYRDDTVVWDDSGPDNNDFLGDRALFFSIVNAADAAQDFVPSTGTAVSCVDNVPPDDSIYIEGNGAGDFSEFQKAPIGIGSNDVAAVIAIGRVFKSDAGTAEGRLGINSNGNTVNSPTFAPGTTGQWFKHVQNTDPNGGIAWTRSAADLAAIRITRDS